MPTKPKTPEDEFRKSVLAVMTGHWLATRHENKSHVDPGTPDLSYVMLGGSYETGWLELKVWRNNGFHVEAGQHNWMRHHCTRIPVHFLLDRDNSWFLLDSKYHHKLADPIGIYELQQLSTAYGHRQEMCARLGSKLRELTHRYGPRVP